MHPPELLAPAGTLKNMNYAFAYGADAVYAGQPRYSLRVRNNDFGLENLCTGIETAHKLGKKFYVASNISPHNAKIKTYLKDMTPIIEMQPDALIMADPGLIMMVREKWPDAIVHLSVQANTVNYASVKFWQSIGIKRVILSRELALEEIAEIRQQCPDMELEVFVHGALCIAYSGRCLLSGYFNHRDPNQGSCTNSCRWDYKMYSSKEDESGDISRTLSTETQTSEPIMFKPDAQQLSEQVFLLEEPQRKGEYMPIFEDEHGTYIMNSKDLRAVQHVAKLMEIGVNSLKIEGRTKSHFYAARTSQVYRCAMDNALAGKPFDMSLMVELDSLANRGYTEGFYRRHVPEAYQNYEQGNSVSTQQQFVGEITGYDAVEQLAEVDVKNKFQIGDQLELMLPEGNQHFILEKMLDAKGQPMDIAPGSGYQVKIALPAENPQMGLIMRQV